MYEPDHLGELDGVVVLLTMVAVVTGLLIP